MFGNWIADTARSANRISLTPRGRSKGRSMKVGVQNSRCHGRVKSAQGRRNAPRRWVTTTTRARRSTVAVALLVVVASCGSTAQWNEQVSAGADGGEFGEPGAELGVDEPSLNGPTGPEEVEGSPGEPGRSQTGGSTGAPTIGDGDSVAERGRNPSGGTSTAPPRGASGRGFTAKEIFVGYGTVKSANEQVAGKGGSSDFGDQEGIAKAIVKDINDRGGIAGRKVVLVFKNFPVNPQGADANAQAACTRWTEDRPVFAVVNTFPAGDQTLNACLAKRQTPHVSTGSALRTASVFSSFAPYLYAPSWPTFERLVPSWMQRLAARGYFDGGWDIDPTRPGAERTKVGILARTGQYGDVFTRLVRQELARKGKDVSATHKSSGSDDLPQAMLRFRRADVTHVISYGAETFRDFANAAESQNYRPRYAMTTTHNLTTREEITPAGQLHGALGVGWIPTSDVNSSSDPGPTSAAQTRCRKMMQKAGQNTGDRSAFNIMTRSCDGFNFLVTAIDKGGLSPQGMWRGAQAMGSLPPASTFRISFSGGRSDGAAAVRDLAYRDDCGCFAYLDSKNHGM